MKQSMLSLLLIFMLAANTFSQVNSTYSLGLNTYRIMQLPRISSQDPLKYITTSFNGGMFKVSDRQISYRLTGSSVNQLVEFHDNCTNCELNKGKVTDYSVKLGFEKSLNYSRIQPYIAFDIGYRYNRFKGLQNFINLEQQITRVSQLETIKNGITLSPALGLRINPVDFISVFAEGSLEFYYSNLQTRLIAQDLTAATTKSSEPKKEFLFTPVTVGVQIHLGSRY